MKIDNVEGVKIIEFDPSYEEQVIDLIGGILVSLSVINYKDLPLDDADLKNIQKIYSGKGKFWIAVKNNKVIGTVAIKNLENQSAKLKRMFVLSEFHGTGLGQQLLNTAIKHAQDFGFNKLILNTHLLMKRAHNFYSKNGFIRTGKNKVRYSFEKQL